MLMIVLNADNKWQQRQFLEYNPWSTTPLGNFFEMKTKVCDGIGAMNMKAFGLNSHTITWVDMCSTASLIVRNIRWLTQNGHLIGFSLEDTGPSE